MFDQPIDTEEGTKKHTKLFEQKKKYKHLEADKKAYIDQSVKVIKKQKTAIDKLKKENDTLKDLIGKMNKENQSAKTITNEVNQELVDELKTAIQEQKQTQKNIDMHISNFHKKITEKRKNCMGMNSGAQSQNNLQKQIKILENRLDKANQKFNETTASNKQLKNIIDSFRRERVIFDNLYKKLEKQLHEKRKKMADIIQKANNAYEQRDKAHNQVQTMKIQAKKQASEFQKEIKEITYLMEKIKLSEYAHKNDRAKQSGLGNQFFEEQAPITDKKIVKQSKKSNDQIQKIHKFREDFAKIEAATQIENFDELLRIFTENQQKNFQMFKFVNLQSNEIEEFQSEVFDLKKQLETSKPMQSSENVQHSKENFVEELQVSLESMKKKLSEIKASYQNNQQEIRPSMTHIERIFETIECDRQLAKELGGGNKAITENNLLIFLAIIQHKSLQIVNTFKELSNPNMLGNTGTINTGGKPQAGNMGMLTFQDFQDNQEYNKILTAEQLREKAKYFIQREQNQKQKKKQVRPKKR